MNKSIWFGLIFLSISWIFLIPIFLPTDPSLGIYFIIIACICNILAFYNTKKVDINKKYFLFYIPLIFVLFILPFPFNISIIILLFGGIIYFILKYILHLEKFYLISYGITFTGIIFLFQTAMFPLFTLLSTHFHRVDFLSYPISFLSNLFGLSTSLNNGIVFVQTGANTFPFTTTLEKLGFVLWFMIFVGALLIFVFSSKFKIFIKNLGLFLIISFFYLIIRYVFLIYIYVSLPIYELDIYYNGFYLLISFIPFIFLVAFVIKLKDYTIDLKCFNKFKIKKNSIFAMILFFVFIFSIVGAFSYYDPGLKKNGQVLIDEYHSDWEDTILKMTEDWYGKNSTYSAYDFANLIDIHYDVDKNADKLLTYDLLKNYSILILKCPNTAYSEQEINDIVRFVEEGGGLYLIGDHTNVFGMNYYLNLVSERFGIIFKYDSTHDLKTGTLSIYQPPTLFNHPITKYFNKLNFLSSCTLKAPITSENVIIGYSLAAGQGTYSSEHFFRLSTYSEPDIEQGLFLQTVAVKHGNGRVVAFTDSTCISNFCIYMDGYLPFYLMTIEYLNRTNEYSYLNSFLLIVAIVSLISFLYFIKKENRLLILLIIISIGLLSFSIATPIFSNMNDNNYKLPSANKNYKSVCFVDEFSDMIISSRTASMDVDFKDVYNNFFIWTQRVDMVPSIENTLSASLKKGNATVIINPNKTFNENDIKNINNYFDKGGNLLIMDRLTNKNSTINELLEIYNLSVIYKPSYENTSEKLEIIGNNFTYFVKNNYSSIAVNNISNGKLVLFVDSKLFSNAIMGGAFTIPSNYQREVYDIEFNIFKNIFNYD